MDRAALKELAGAGAMRLCLRRETGSDRLLLLSGDAIRWDLRAGMAMQQSRCQQFSPQTFSHLTLLSPLADRSGDSL